MRVISFGRRDFPKALDYLHANGDEAVLIDYSVPPRYGDLADEFYSFSSIGTAEALSELLQPIHADALVSMAATDDWVLTLARAIEKSGFRTARVCAQPVEVAATCEDKRRTRTAFTALGARLTPLAAETDFSHGAMVVIKPLKGWSGRGIRILRGGPESKQLASADDVIVERFIPGHELSVVTFCYQESCLVFPVVYKGLTTAPGHPLDRARMCPSPLPAEVTDRAKGLATELSRRIGSVGFMEFEFILTREELMLVEVNARISGTTPMIGEATGVSMTLVPYRAIAGYDLVPVESPPAWAVLELPIPRETDEDLVTELRKRGSVRGLQSHNTEYSRGRLLICVESIAELEHELDCLVAALSLEDEVWREPINLLREAFTSHDHCVVSFGS